MVFLFGVELYANPLCEGKLFSFVFIPGAHQVKFGAELYAQNYY
jgi:hypothetical protein